MLVLLGLAVVVQAATVTIRNDVPRLDDRGLVIDAHSGLIVEHGGVYFLYGERYGNTTGMDYEWLAQGAPKVGVYTSTDMHIWHDQGQILEGSGTQWVPWVFFDEKNGRFVAWYGQGDWGVAISDDGIHFSQPEGVPLHQTSRLGGQTDGNLVFIDDDGQGYVIFSATDLGHRVSIERLTPDYLQSSKVNVSDFFPDTWVECPMLFKRKDIYYVTYGHCCCACRIGAGLVVFTSDSIYGPWTRQTPNSDVNCKDGDSAICTDGFVIPGQGYTFSNIHVSNGNDPAMIWMANLWLQGPGNNPACMNLCDDPAPEQCTTGGQPKYRVGQDPTYWTPIEFGEDGRIFPLAWQDSFQLQLP